MKAAGAKDIRYERIDNGDHGVAYEHYLERSFNAINRFLGDVLVTNPTDLLQHQEDGKFRFTVKACRTPARVLAALESCLISYFVVTVHLTGGSPSDSAVITIEPV